MTPTPLDFITRTKWSDLPVAVRDQTGLAMLDILGIATGGAVTPLSRIIRDYAAVEHPGPLPLPFDGRGVSVTGYALALGMTIDALDGHDGFNPAKGHIGCPLIPALLALGAEAGASGQGFALAVALGYEIGARAAMAQHAAVADYHTSGSWGAVAAAAAGGVVTGLGQGALRHAMGIAEYHGPRSQMMRCIDHPTMLKDGSGWGAMCGAGAVRLARAGFTGAPALIVEEAPEHWADLGARWYGLEQYYKPYPVCRWAQGPVEGVLALRREHGLRAADVDRIEVESFHEALRLAKRRPETTEEAQYSTSYPAAVAMVHGDVRAENLSGEALQDPEVLRLSDGLVLQEAAKANAGFPSQRFARVCLQLRDGRRLQGGWVEPKWSVADTPSALELRAKFDALTMPALGASRSAQLAEAALNLSAPSDILDLLAAPRE